MQKLLFVIAVVFFTTIGILAQEVSIGLSAFGNNHKPLTSEFDSYSHGTRVLNGITYSDTLARKWDYKVGLAYNERLTDYYFSFVDIEGVGLDSMPVVSFWSVGDLYKSTGIAMTLGGVYWPKSKRLGWFMPLDVIPILRTSTELQKTRLTDEGDITINYIESDVHTNLHFHIRTGIGYKLIVYKGLSISAVYNLGLRVGKLFRDVDDSFAFNRGITLMAGYKF